VEIYNLTQISECGNWERGLAVSFLGIHKTNLHFSVGQQSFVDASVKFKAVPIKLQCCNFIVIVLSLEEIEPIPKVLYCLKGQCNENLCRSFWKG
jgi:hypothetical protein